MLTAQFDLLEEPLLTASTRDGAEFGSLPVMLAHLGGDSIVGFAALQIHQQHAWHAFLTQVAALALHHSDRSDPVQSAAQWRSDLLALTAGRHEPWCLFVDDLKQPAFLQSPAGDSLPVYKSVLRTPDELDVLLTAKNHDVKAARVDHPRAEHWAYALVSLQTMQGFLGAGNYGVARMNGGFASRPGVGLAADGLGLGARFRRDVGVLLAGRAELVRLHEYRNSGGLDLLWLQEWDGNTPLSLADCDPFFVEVCRRVRAVINGDHIEFRAGSSTTARVQSKERKGNVGDPWTPIHRDEHKALTISGKGFDYQTVHKLLFEEEYSPGAALQRHPTDPEKMALVASVLARGQGETQGYHERIVPVPKKIFGMRARQPDQWNRLADLSKHRIQVASDMQKKVLRPALCVLCQGDPLDVDWGDRRPDRWQERHDRRVDSIFFERLWNDVEVDASSDRGWIDEMRKLANEILAEAIDDVPLPAARRFRIIARVEGLFHGRLAAVFPPSKPPQEGPHWKEPFA